MEMKKIIIPLIISILLIIIIWIAGFMVGIFSIPEPLMKFFKDDSETRSYVDIIHKSYPTDVIIYGKEMEFEEEIKRRYVDELSEKTLARDKKYDYTAIVINDLDDSVTLDDKTIAYIDYLLNQETYLLVYYGKKYSKTWDDFEQAKLEISVEGNLANSYYNFMGERQKAIGTWTETNQKDVEKYPYTLGGIILYEIVDYLEEIN